MAKSAVDVITKTMNEAGLAASLGVDASGVCSLGDIPAPSVGLTESQANAVSEYQNGAGINIPLREGRALTDLYAKQVADLDSAMRAHAVAEETTAYRGMHPFWTKNLKEGMEFVDLGFVSVTTDPAIAKGFGAAVAEIQVPAGTRGLDVTKLLGERNRYLQKEVLLDRGLRFRVAKIDGQKFYLEVIQ